MNEINQLKSEHARYRKALKNICENFNNSSAACRVANEALKPPPPLPVTLDELKTALESYNKKHSAVSIHFFRDESGSIRDGDEKRVFSFNTLREAVDFLTR